jgi:O-antigen/teichoic acid export membrane protein
MTHRKSFFNAVAWAYVMQGTEQSLNVLLTFVFAMMLGPKDFGTMAMAMAYILFIKMFLEQGLVPALIQRKDLRPEHLDSVFWLNLAASFALVFLSVSLSRWWASLNHLALLAPIISVLSLTIPLQGLTIVQRAVLEREMDFKSFSIRSIVAITAGGIVGLAMVFEGYGVWALVGNQLSTDLVGLVTLWRLSHWRPRLRFSLGSVKELLAFSTRSFAGNLGFFVNNQLDALLIGLFFGPVPVGLYRLAGRITSTIVSVGTSSLQAASFPQFCRLQDKPDELRQSVLTCVRMAAIITVPMLAGLAVISGPLLSAIGSQWIDGTNALRILCVVAIVQPIFYFVGPLLQALSRPHHLALLEWGHTAIAAGSWVLAGELLKHESTPVQITGIAATRFVTAVLLLTPVIVWLFRQLADVRFGQLLQVMAPSFLAGGAVGFVVFATSSSVLFQMMSPWPALLSEIVVGGIAASGMLLWLDRELRRTAEELLMKVRALGLAVWPPKNSITPQADPPQATKD